MSGSAIFSAGVNTLRESSPSAIMSATVQALRERSPSAIFATDVSYTFDIVVPNIVGTSGAGLLTPQDILINSAGILVIDGTKRVIATVAGIDATATGVTLLYTVPTNKRVLVTEVVINSISATAISSPATLGVGIASGEDDIISPESLTALTLTGQQYSLDIGGVGRIALAGETINLGIDVAAVGTAQTFDVYLIGIQAAV